MHLRCCSVITKAQIKVVELRVAHPRALESLKKFKKWTSYAYFVSRGQKHSKKIPWSLSNSLIILLMHEQMFNDHMTLILSPTLGHYHFLYAYIYQNFVYVSSLLKISDHDVASTTLKLNCLKLKCFKLVPS